jgi:hypothetical protein
MKIQSVTERGVKSLAKLAVCELRNLIVLVSAQGTANATRQAHIRDLVQR